MEQADDWERLIESLDAWTWATETAPGRIAVSLPQGGVSRHVVIVMTPDEWDDMAGVMWGNFDDAVQDVKRTLLALQPEEGFAVYSEYRLEPSTATALPVPQEFTPEPDGEWVAYDREGGIASRFADRSEPDTHD
jgi:hypothetical protein